ncbi:MAG: DUF1749 domain-containing protein [Clostridia bacterium]|nr:DUF1749 domain-containing protein [Clostridia bacterium]
MNIQTIFFNATDGVDLKGFIYKSKNETRKILISVHGMATNCIKKRDEKIAEKINELNMDILVFNNRGHDLINYIKKENKEKEELAGTSYEEISECYNDILGAINYSIKNGYDEIYLMGHSLGSTKIVYAYNKFLKENTDIVSKIKGIILLSLVDIPTALTIYLQDDFPAIVTYAKNIKKEGMGNQLMPEKSFIHPISVKTFLRYTIENNDINFARFSDNLYDFEELNNIKVPLFMRWGNNKELIVQKADELCEFLQSKIKNEDLDIGYIDEANHSYSGKEEILANEIAKYIKKYYNN